MQFYCHSSVFVLRYKLGCEVFVINVSLLCIFVTIPPLLSHNNVL